jgi:osmoprotectant transport system permease protein
MFASNTQRWLWWDWIERNTDLIRHDLWIHVELTFLAVAIGLAISIPLGLYAQRHRRWLGPILGAAGVLYTIPSIAAFALLIPYFGAGIATVLVPLVAYTLLILVRNVVTGLDAIPPEVRDAAQGMGYSPRSRFVRLELPLALPAIMAGARVATVSTIGLLTIAGAVGLGGLGHLISIGLTRPIRTAVTVGAVLSVALAIIADVSLAGLQRLLTPWVRATAQATPQPSNGSTRERRRLRLGWGS